MSEKKQDSTWPLPKFYFLVTFGSFASDIPFQEVSGLDPETEVIEYRHGNNKMPAQVKMPGINKSSNVTLKKGIFLKDNYFWEWFNKIKLNIIKREMVVIKLMDEKGKPTMTWTLSNAWPMKITGPDLESQGDEIAIETIEIAHEGLTIQHE